MTIETLIELFPLQIPIANKDGKIWDGKPWNYSNLAELHLQMSQRFGQSLLDYSRFGMIGHNGIDVAGVRGTPIVAPIRMFITRVDESDRGYGYNVFAETESITINGETVKLELVFGHFDYIDAVPYKWVDAGHFLGGMDSTGWSTGDHLHFGIRPWIRQKDGSWAQLFKNNGYLGYVDPELFLPHIVWDWREVIEEQLINDKIKNIMENNEKKIVIEGTPGSAGRKGIIINGKLREIKEGREADAALYVLNNNGFGKTISSDEFDKMPKDAEF